MPITRRDFLLRSAGYVSISAMVPRWSVTGARGFEESVGASQSGRTLVVLELMGGNDGINTVIPYADSQYPVVRSRIGIPVGSVIQLDSTLGFMIETRYLDRAEIPGIPTLAETPAVIAYAPAGHPAFSGDVVVLAVTPSQSTLVYEAALKAGIAQMAILRRAPTLAEVASTAAFLASDRASGITGSIVNVTSGLLVGPA